MAEGGWPHRPTSAQCGLDTMSYRHHKIRLVLILLPALVILLACNAPYLFRMPHGAAQATPVSIQVVERRWQRAAALIPTATIAPIPTASLTPTPTTAPTPAILIGAGDISVCGLPDDMKTAALIELLIQKYPEAAVFTAGDNVQIIGELNEFTRCFQPAWGQFKRRIHPSPGNHDWSTERGGPYFTYFGEAAGPPGLGYYSYDLGDWHMVSLNSNCEDTRCDEKSPQAQWLIEDLRENEKQCTLLYWHHPLWDTGTVPISQAGAAFWRIASQYGADVVVNGHDHHYERFVPLDGDGKVDPSYGIRTFIVGTGGAWLFELGQPQPISEVRDNSTHGVIQFTLYSDRYDWAFVPVEGGTFTDAGSALCH